MTTFEPEPGRIGWYPQTQAHFGSMLEKDAEVIHDLRLKLAHAEEELAAYRELMTIKKESND